MKVIIIGNAGTGKSTLARQLAAQTGWPLLALDRLWHAMDYSHAAELKLLQAQRQFMNAQSDWIIDGNYSRTLAPRLREADLVIWCQTSRLLASIRVIRRSLRFRIHPESRPDMPPMFKEHFNRDYWIFLKLIWQYPQRVSQSVVPLLRQMRSDQQLVVVHSQSEKRQLLHRIVRMS